MSTRPPQESPGLLDHLTMRYLRRALDVSHPTDEPYVMSDDEVFLTRRVANAVLTTTAVVGILTVLLFQIPRLMWPAFFSSTDVSLGNLLLELPLITVLYAMLLLYLAVHLTTGVNKLGARAIAQICQFPRLHDARYEHHVDTMARLIRTKRPAYRPDLSLRAYLMQARAGLLLYFLLNLTAGFCLSTAITVVLFTYVSPGLAIFVGSTLYVGWLIYWANLLLFELKIRIMAPLTIRSFVNELREEWHTDSDFQAMLTDVLNYAGVLNRLHIYAHLLLAETLTDRVNAATLPHSPDDFLPKVAALPPDRQRSIERLLIFSLLIDGHFTAKERERLQKLQDHKLLTYSMDDVSQLHKDYIAGKGLWL